MKEEVTQAQERKERKRAKGKENKKVKKGKERFKKKKKLNQETKVSFSHTDKTHRVSEELNYIDTFQSDKEQQLEEKIKNGNDKIKEDISLKTLYNNKKPLQNISIKHTSYDSVKYRKIEKHNKTLPKIKIRERKSLVALKIKTYPSPRIRKKGNIDKRIRIEISDRLTKEESERKEQEPSIHTTPIIDDFWFLIDFEKDDYAIFEDMIGSKSPLAVLILAKNDKMTLEDTLQNLFTDEYVRKMGKIDADIELSSLTNRDIITTIYSRDNLEDKDKMEKYLDGLSAEIDKSSNEGKKLIIFKFSIASFKKNREKIENIMNKIKKKGISTIKVKLDFEELEKDFQIQKLISSLCWIYSIPSFNWEKNFYISSDSATFLDFDLIRTELEATKRRLFQNLTRKYVDLMEPSWSIESDEHRRMKIPTYNSLLYYIKHKFGKDESSIRIEKRYETDETDEKLEYYISGEPFKSKTEKNPIPDLYVQNEVWVEIETLRGHSDVIMHIYDKLKVKFDQIKKFRELWIVLPNIEYFFHRRDLISLKEQLIKKLNKDKIIVKFFGIDYNSKKLIYIKD